MAMRYCNYFSKILKQKKILFFIFLPLFVFTFSLALRIPLAHADCTDITCTCVEGECITYGGFSWFGNVLGLKSGPTPGVNGYLCHKNSDCPGSSGQVVEDAKKYIAAAIVFAVFCLIAAYSLAVMGILLAVRYAVLTALFILSPLAFIFWVFPATKNLWTKWWSAFIEWAFVGVGASFFIYLASKTIGTGSVSVNNIFVAFVFLLVGYKLVRSLSPKISGAVIGLATGAAGLAMGAVGAGGLAGKLLGKHGATGASIGGAVGGVVGGATGLNRASAWAKTKAMQAAEKLRFIPPGSARQPERKAVDDYKKNFANLNNQQITDNLNKSRVYTREGVRQKAALAEVAAERGILDPNNTKHVAGLKDAQARGLNLDSKHINKDPRLAGLDPNRTDGIKKQINPITGRNYTEAEAGTEATKRAVEGMTAKEQRSMSAKALEDPGVLEHLDFTDARTMNEFKKASKSRIDSLHKLHTYDPNPNSPFQKIGRRIAELQATGNPADADRADKLLTNRIEIAGNLP